MVNGWQNALEGKFKFEHARVRMCSESIAFFGGERRERELLNKRWVGEGREARLGAAMCGKVRFIREVGRGAVR